jgi:hypothetical protein
MSGATGNEKDPFSGLAARVFESRTLPKNKASIAENPASDPTRAGGGKAHWPADRDGLGKNRPSGGR